MSEPYPDPRDLIARIVDLERRRRLLRTLAGLAMILAVTGLAAFTADDPGTVQAQRVELVNAKGDTRAVLAADTSGVTLTLFDRRGHVTGSLRLNDDPRVAVLDGSGREMAGLGAPRVQHLVQ